MRLLFIFLASCAAPVVFMGPASAPMVIRITDERCVDGKRAAMTSAEAEQVFVEFRADIEKQVPIEPLRTPRSLDDVLEILRRDQIDLFAHGVAFAGKEQGTRARVLEAQLELAWGEALVMVAQLLERQFAEVAMQSLRQRARAAIGQTTSFETKTMLELSENLQKSRRAIDAMWVLAPVHIERGAQMALKLLQDVPDDYHGYRVAADYFRLRADWKSFDKMVEEVAKRKPDSTGLQFLLGVAAVDRFGDRERGAEKLQKAIAGDPKFAKAQAMLLLLADTPNASYEALVALHKVNPSHQLVVLAGPAILAVYNAWKARGGEQGEGQL
ncbi:MAG: hypothetical protein IT381_11895 [Deltaproteobacteria bacterium]|nr:hypothetical protein [Deltaproteobacteria bacterium]